MVCNGMDESVEMCEITGHLKQYNKTVETIVE